MTPCTFLRGGGEVKEGEVTAKTPYECHDSSVVACDGPLTRSLSAISLYHIILSPIAGNIVTATVDTKVGAIYSRRG